MCDCPRIGGVKTRPETERQAIERLTAENVRLRQRAKSAKAEGEAARTAEIVAWARENAYEATCLGDDEVGDRWRKITDAIARDFNPEADDV